MADEKFNPGEREFVTALLFEIVGEVTTLKVLCNEACGAGGNADLDAAAASLAEKVGWMADYGLKRLGAMPGRGGPEEWLFSARMRDLLKAENPSSTH